MYFKVSGNQTKKRKKTLVEKSTEDWQDAMTISMYMVIGIKKYHN